jgi:hypothetical protein
MSERDRAAVSKAISPTVPAAAPSRQNIIDFMFTTFQLPGDERRWCGIVRFLWTAFRVVGMPLKGGTQLA